MMWQYTVSDLPIDLNHKMHHVGLRVSMFHENRRSLYFMYLRQEFVPVHSVEHLWGQGEGLARNHGSWLCAGHTSCSTPNSSNQTSQLTQRSRAGNVPQNTFSTEHVSSAPRSSDGVLGTAPLASWLSCCCSWTLPLSNGITDSWPWNLRQGLKSSYCRGGILLHVHIIHAYVRYRYM